MSLTAVIRRTLVVVAVLLSSAALAQAGHRGAMSLDEPVRAHPPAPVLRAAPTSPRASLDDQPTLVRTPVPSVPCTTTVRPDPNRAPARPYLPSLPDRRDHRATTGNTARVHVPPTHRSKGQVRNTPATPGMGLLLRFSANAGSEISMNLDAAARGPSSRHPGRAPPASYGPSTPAPAARPRPATPLAIPSRGPRPGSLSGAMTRFRTPADDLHAASMPRRAPAPARVAACVQATPACLRTERTTRSRAARMKGAAACLTPPFGGRNA